MEDLASFSSKYYRIGQSTFLLDKSGLKYILERHHPKYWNGSLPSGFPNTPQSFFKREMSIDGVVSAIEEVIRQNRDKIAANANSYMFTVSGYVNGKLYELGFKKCRIGHFVPKD